MSDSEGTSTSDDGVDEFGFPHPAVGNNGTAEEGPLVLMENWDGQFVLVQPRQERSRSRRRGSRGSRTAGSIGDSTVFSGTDQQGLIIDADAMEEGSSSSEWSGMSDEDGGDTTDSMAEEDMPMLDSPALDLLIGEQLANVSVGVTVNGTSTFASPPPPRPPAIVITDTAMDLNGSLCTPGLGTPAMPPGGEMETPQLINGIDHTYPATPIPNPTPPMMGTFHPTTDNPAQHAVIDGSKIPTKSPFTHRRRSRRGRAGSLASSSARSIDLPERKRKSSTTTTLAHRPTEPFFPSTLPKRARYSSIPGHPRFVAARKAAHAHTMAMMGLGGMGMGMGEFVEREDTPSEEEQVEGLDIEDMLESSILNHSSGGESVSGDRHFRFDRVPVSTYLRRNFGTGGGRGGGAVAGSTPHRDGSGRQVQDLGIGIAGYASSHHPFSSPVGRSNTGGAFTTPLGGGFGGVGMGLGGGYELGYGGGYGDSFGLGDTLAGPPPRMMLVSPGLYAVREVVGGDENGSGEPTLSRKEKRRRKRGLAGVTGMNGGGGGGVIPPLQI